MSNRHIPYDLRLLAHMCNKGKIGVSLDFFSSSEDVYRTVMALYTYGWLDVIKVTRLSSSSAVWTLSLKMESSDFESIIETYYEVSLL